MSMGNTQLKRQNGKKFLCKKDRWQEVEIVIVTISIILDRNQRKISFGRLIPCYKTNFIVTTIFLSGNQNDWNINILLNVLENY